MVQSNPYAPVLDDGINVPDAAGWEEPATHAPTINSLTPNTGTGDGGTVVTITGHHFTTVTGVTFGGTPGTGLSITDDGTLVVVSPAHAAGAVNVVITNPTGAKTVTGGFTYGATTDVAPSITTVAPVSGTKEGSTTVTITGDNLFDVTGVTFGGSAGVNLAVIDDHRLTVDTPAHANGAVDVAATNPHGTGTKTGGFTFTEPPPSIDTIVPDNGTAAGNTTVTITGTHFTTVTSVTFGGDPGHSLTVNNDGELTVHTPAHGTTEAVNVQVHSPTGTTTSLAGYTYT